MSLLDQARNSGERASSDYTFGTSSDEAGAGHEGVVTEIFVKQSQFSEKMESHFVIRRDDGKTVLIWGSRSVLRAELEKIYPEIGDRLAVVYVGPSEIKSGRWAGKNAHVYRVAIAKAGTNGSGKDSAGNDDVVPF